MRHGVFGAVDDKPLYLAYLITQARLRLKSIEEALLSAMERLEGAYSLVLMSAAKLIAARDPHGFRPLCYGKTKDGRYVVASETCALEAVGAELIRDLRPGEVIVFTNDQTESSVKITPYTRHIGICEKKTCIFEYIYFARPDSVIDGISVHDARLKAGRILAENDGSDIADVVIGVPDSGLDAALGYAACAGLPYGQGFIKNKYIGRTFISPTQSERADQVRIKLNPIRSTVEGKRVILVDDSIVRGTTSRRIVRLLKDAGATEVHVRISAPPFIAPCYYGTDIDSRDNLIANKHSVEDICRLIEADSLKYLPIGRLCELAGDGYCDACFSDSYPTPVPTGFNKDRFERRLSERGKKN